MHTWTGSYYPFFFVLLIPMSSEHIMCKAFSLVAVEITQNGIRNLQHPIWQCCMTHDCQFSLSLFHSSFFLSSALVLVEHKQLPWALMFFILQQNQKVEVSEWNQGNLSNNKTRKHTTSTYKQWRIPFFIKISSCPSKIKWWKQGAILFYLAYHSKRYNTRSISSVGCP